MAVPDALRSLRLPSLGGRFSLALLLEGWRDALLSCLPQPMRRLLARREQVLVVVPEGATAKVLIAQGSEQPVALGELDPHAPGSLQGMLAGIKSGRRRTVVRLAKDRILVREASFPAQVRDNLAQVLRYEMDRLSPFQADQVYFDFRLLDVPARAEKVRIELVLCRRELVGDWLEQLRDKGAPVDQLTWEGAWPKANLLPPQERPRHGSGFFSPSKLLLLLVILLAAAALASPIWQMRQIRDQATERVAELKGQAEEVHEIRAALERARQGSVAVLQQKWSQPRMIDLLRELTERLPDDTWVQNLDFRDGEIQIRGESARATALIELLDQAPGITEVSFRSPVVQVRGTERERFHISLKYNRPEES